MDTTDTHRKINMELDKSFFYETNDSRKKMAFIFNHFKFNRPPGSQSAPTDRPGTERDRDVIFNCLRARGFVVEAFEDASKTVITNTLQNVGQLKKADVSCIVIVIMSHGDTDIIYAKDEPYAVSELFEPFVKRSCDLDGIPKLYFIQACRGEKLDDGWIMEADGPRDVTDSSRYDVPYEIPPGPDMLCMFSTAKEHLSWRNRYNGSWFIQTLCKYLEIHKEKDILHLLTLVNNEIAEEYASNTLNPSDSRTLVTHNKKQMAHIECTLTKLLIF